ncbi:hypothetical protein CBR_g47 [Chara braunii]|uniref:Acylamino-acid-releasing enzyme n=1 Tax=Chara braunii TaxID=69332 RepID=A0A388JLE8_CHABU|nr:hypothetical protein CBR_g47 [Chara braunii]|eukprot:GBG58646.1 hypothetical protein CBR_g47 [Chara braunii]
MLGVASGRTLSHIPAISQRACHFRPAHALSYRAALRGPLSGSRLSLIHGPIGSGTRCYRRRSIACPIPIVVEDLSSSPSPCQPLAKRVTSSGSSSGGRCSITGAVCSRSGSAAGSGCVFPGAKELSLSFCALPSPGFDTAFLSSVQYRTNRLGRGRRFSPPSPSPFPSPSPIRLPLTTSTTATGSRRGATTGRSEAESGWRREEGGPSSTTTVGGHSKAKEGEDMAAMAVSACWPDTSLPVEPDVALLESFAAVASIERAWIVKPRAGGLDIILAMSQRNLLANAVRRFVSTVRLADSATERLPSQWSPFPLETSGVTLLSPSPSGQRMLLVRNGQQPHGSNPKDGPPPVKFEVWGRGHLVKEVLIPSSMHRAVYTDGWFESVSWSPDESRIAYVAEEPAPPRPVFGRRMANGRDGTLSPTSGGAGMGTATASSGEAGGRGGRGGMAVGSSGTASGTNDVGTWKGHGDWVEDWGERYTGKGRPVLFVFDIDSCRVQRVEGIPPSVSAGQVVWAPTSLESRGAGDAPAVAGAKPFSPPPTAGAPPATLVFVGWSSTATNFNHTCKKLGMVYCYNRPSALFAVPAPSFATTSEEASRAAAGGGGGGGGGEERAAARPGGAGEGDVRPQAVKLTKDISSAFSPRFSPDGRILAFLSSHAAVDTGLHGGTASLHVLEWPFGGGFHVDEEGAAIQVPMRTVVDVVGRASSPGSFPGLYSSGFIKNPWLSDGRTLVVNTTWRSTQAIITVHVESGLVQRITPGPQSYNLLDVRDDLIVASVSAPNRPPLLTIAQTSRDSSVVLWKEVPFPQMEYPRDVEAALKAIRYEILQVPVPVIEGSERLSPGAAEPFEAMLLYKADMGGGVGGQQEPAAAPPSPPRPLILVPHGGPHSVFITSYAMAHAYLCAMGYAVLAVNYRGSLGFGEEAIQSLPGNVGRQDVADMLQALGFAIQHCNMLDRTRVAIIGGSHGGFLAAHLIGQAPDLFRTAVLRNPVCNVSSMVGITDIPDWCFTEAMGGVRGPSAYSEIPRVEDLQTFYRISPAAHIDKVKVPTLFLLGKEDRRVPMSNALQYVHALRSRGLEARVVVFPEDNHALDKPQTEFETWVTVASWLRQHL